MVKIELNELYGGYDYESDDWEELDLTIGRNSHLSYIEVDPPVTAVYQTGGLEISLVPLNCITFKNQEDEEYLRKMLNIKNIIC